MKSEHIEDERLMRSFLFACMILSCVVCGKGQEYRLYIGTYTGGESKGIYSSQFDAETGEFDPVKLAAVSSNPSFLAIHPSGNFLYAVNEIDSFQSQRTGAVSTFTIDRQGSSLRLLQQVSSLGPSPAHVALDISARFLMVANYNGGNAVIFPIAEDGLLRSHSAFVQDTGSGVNPQRQNGPHPHFIRSTNDNQFVLVADLGIDKVLIYRFDPRKGTLTPGTPAFINMDPGAGPRHFAFSPDGNHLYVLNELASTVSVFNIRLQSGTAEKSQQISTLTDGFSGNNTSAEIVVDGRGKYLYASNRGDNSIVRFTIDAASGDLTDPVRTPTGGVVPRFFCIDPTGRWLVCANQESDNVTLFRIDQQNGQLTPTPQIMKVISPVCIQFAPVNEHRKQ